MSDTGFDDLDSGLTSFDGLDPVLRLGEVLVEGGDAELENLLGPGETLVQVIDNSDRAVPALLQAADLEIEMILDRLRA